MLVRRPLRRFVAAATASVLVVGLSACTAPDVLTQGQRPNRPTSTTSSTPSKETDPGKLAIEASSLPGYQAPRSLGGSVFERSTVDGQGTISWKALGADNEPITQPGTAPVAFGDPSTYTAIPGILTFRGNNYRNTAAYGVADISAKKMEIAWTHDTGDVKAEGSYWAGAGWTGQPLMVNWPRATKEAMGLDAAQVNDDGFVEVIYPVVDGKVYRMNLATGQDVKPPIDTGFAFKGTGSVDPRGYPLLYAGMGLDQNGDNKGEWRYRIFDLIQNKEVNGWSGSDPAAPRNNWGAFDSSALINGPSDTLIEPAENGLVYKAKLNAQFDPAAKTVSVNPEVTKLRYTTGDANRHGIESSAVGYRNLMYATDNDGFLVCWDAITLQVLWALPTGDDTDATLVLEETTEGPFLYTGNEYDKRGEAGGKSGPITIQKINALTGQQVWKWEIDAQYNKAVNGGVMATPALGFGEVSDLVIFQIAKTASDKQGTIVALDKTSGTMVWQKTTGAFGWSSPVLVPGKDGHVYGIVGDSSGVLHLFNPNTGEDYSTLQLEKNIEASPAVYNNMLVVGTYAKKLYGIKLS